MLQPQAAYENERRWLSLDLLTGRVGPHHPFHDRLIAHGIAERDLKAFTENPCPPDIIGIDEYLTSDRFLDEHLERYPGETPGGNGRQAYVDVAAVRAGVSESDFGFLPRVMETWGRYKLPLALTEVHNGCTRDEQLRWLMGAWSAANSARARGVDLRAVSVWSLFGAVDWNSLLTRAAGHYEPGAFDIRSQPPRPTAVATAARALAKTGHFDHPCLDRKGWWTAEEQQSSARSMQVQLDYPSELAAVMADRLATRRITIDRRDVGDGADRIRQNGNHRLRLFCRYCERDGILIAEAAAGLDPNCFVDAFLDLMIDRSIGEFQITLDGSRIRIATNR
jgi:dTDP-4-dehydrorhamnose reductase